MRDPYDVLGVSKGATAAEIKVAFRRLAKKLHPDANKHDVKAAARFAELNAAYEIVGDAAKRKAFDRGEIDAEGKPRFRGFEGFGEGAGGHRSGRFDSFGFGFGSDGFARAGSGAGAHAFGAAGLDDVLKGFFSGLGGGARRRAGAPFEPEEFAEPPSRDAAVTVTITLNEAAHGAKKRVRLPSGKEVEVAIPAGLTEGKQIRLRGQGFPGGNGAAGDALVTVSIAPHPLFTPEGADLRLDLPITPYEAVLGGKVRVPTLDGAVEFALPAGTAAGRTFRLKGKGLPAKGGHGDLLATVLIVLPDQADPELVEFMRKWRDQKAYDPRSDLA